MKVRREVEASWTSSANKKYGVASCEAEEYS